MKLFFSFFYEKTCESGSSEDLDENFRLHFPLPKRGQPSYAEESFETSSGNSTPWRGDSPPPVRPLSLVVPRYDALLVPGTSSFGKCLVVFFWEVVFISKPLF